MSDTYQLFIRPDGLLGPIESVIYDGDDRVDVLDIAARNQQQARNRLPVHQVSMYRHALILRGMTYQIINVRSQAYGTGYATTSCC